MNPGISRIEVARKLGLDKSTVTNLMSELIDIGVVQVGDELDASPHGGRKPIQLAINGDFAAVVGIELQTDYYQAVVSNLSGEILYSEADHLDVSRDTLPDRFMEVYHRVTAETAKTDVPILGVGLGMSGIINPHKGIIVKSIPLGITEPYSFAREIAGSLDVPAFVENDANACAWGELAFHKSERLRNYMFALVEFRRGDYGKSEYGGIGVGLGIVIDGRVHYGSEFYGGEFRSVFWNGRNMGQLSLPLSEARHIGTDREIQTKFSRELAKNIALFVNTLNLNQVFVGGDLQSYQIPFDQILIEEIRNNWVYDIEDIHCTVSYSSVGEKAVAYGAAGMLLERMFTSRHLLATEERTISGMTSLLDRLEPIGKRSPVEGN
jgi:predicted NBD/HSP70 family sugar kinase